MRTLPRLLQSLRNPLFARLYAAQTTSLLGDAFTWVALALLAFEVGGAKSASILAGALTLRVTAFVLLSPWAGILADRVDRRKLMAGADLGRMGVVGLMPWVSEVWQIYALMFLLNALTAFFTPAYQAALPQVMKQKDYAQAIALSGATYEVLGVLGPGIAGALAGLLGAQNLFLLNGITFLFSTLLILTLPASLRVERENTPTSPLGDIREGTLWLWRDGPLRYALLLGLSAAVSGALVLVGTVGLVRGRLGLGELEYGWTMAAFGIGATLAALVMGAWENRIPRTTFVLLGALVSSLAVLPADWASLHLLLFLWVLAGAGQNWVNLPTQALIADRTPEALQGRVYGAHFAWSHLWWVLAYPIAGWLGTHFPDKAFLYGGLVALGLLLGVELLFKSWKRPR